MGCRYPVPNCPAAAEGYVTSTTVVLCRMYEFCRGRKWCEEPPNKKSEIRKPSNQGSQQYFGSDLGFPCDTHTE
jgi:hypothetical protein